MKAKIRSVLSPDADLTTFAPVDPTNVCLYLQIIAGPAVEPGEESFDLTVCTPTALAGLLSTVPFLIGRHYLFVSIWNTDQVLNFIKSAFEEMEGASWEELGKKLSRIGTWEFEDYQV